MRLDVAARCRAIAAELPPGSFFSSATAAALMQVPLPSRHQAADDIHIAVLSADRALEGRGIVGHRTRLMGDDWWHYDGLRISTADRAWCELGVLLSISELVAAGDWLVNVTSPLTTIEKLWDALRRYPDRRAKRKLRAAGDLLDGRSASPLESELRVILVRGGIVGLESNWPVRIAGQTHWIDLTIPGRRVAIEYRGSYHRDAVEWRLERTRILTLESEGWVVIQVYAHDLRGPAELVARVRRVVARRPYFLS